VSGPAPRRTKIVCTIGPATASPEMVEQLAWAGMDAARLNFSHGDHGTHLASIQAVRRAQELIGRPLAVIADLQGPKLRIAPDAQPRSVTPGDTLVFASVVGAAPGEVGVTFDGLAEAAFPGQEILVADGAVRTRVTDVSGGRVETRVEVGGLVSAGKGVNLPGARLPIPSMTEKDAADLAFALDHGVDYVALSFVCTADDVSGLRERIDAAGSRARVIAKIERGDALEHLDEIVEASDGVMVARGDLGVEIGAAEVPLVQKLIIRTARDAGRTVITATQMLESMIHQPEPTRAEASDVANAVLDGTSAVMLSGETAAGSYPLEAVATMHRIVRAVEPSLAYQDRRRRNEGEASATLAHAACDIAEELDATVIGCPTQSGSTPRHVSKFRPPRPIVAASPDQAVLQQLALDWAVVPVAIEGAESIEQLWARTLEVIRRSGLAAPGERVVITGGTLLNQPGTSDHVLVRVVE
jgi:pyruvate kinase